MTSGKTSGHGENCEEAVVIQQRDNSGAPQRPQRTAGKTPGHGENCEGAVVKQRGTSGAPKQPAKPVGVTKKPTMSRGTPYAAAPAVRIGSCKARVVNHFLAAAPAVSARNVEVTRKETSEKAKEKIKGHLGVFAEIRAAGALQPMQDNSGWEEMVSIIDSGASVPVINPTVGRQYEMQESQASRNGVCYQIANGDSLPNLGEKIMAVVTDEGTIRAYKTQVAEVTSNLQSVRAMLKSHHAVVFDEDGSYAVNKITGEVNYITDDGSTYVMRHWIIPPDQIDHEMEAAGFRRQE